MTAAVEAPSGKGSGEENFPVGSWLIAAPLRPHIAVFYAFARAADDIADNPSLSPEDKVARLDALAAGLDGTRTDDAVAKAVRMRASLAATNVDPRHCHDLLDAFRQDATKRRYADWGELMGYCAHTASPVGRYLLDLHGEDQSIWTASDALCDALQVLNHLQDCAADYRDLDRVYLPQDWLAAEGSSFADLTAPASTPGLRRVLDLCLDRTAQLIDRAKPLAARLRSTRLALESAVIVGVAEHLERALRKGDPIAERVQLSKPGFLQAALSGSLRHALLPRLGLTPALESAR